jgi:hypothetical protein
MKKYHYILLNLLLSALLVVLVYFFSGVSTEVKNGFHRKFDPRPVVKLAQLDLQYNSYYISGLTNHTIFLGNVIGTRALLTCSFNLKDTARSRLAFAFDPNVKWQAARIKIDSPVIYLTESLSPAMLTANYPFHHPQTKNLKSLRIDQIEVLSPNSILVRKYDLRTKQRILQKLNIGGIITEGKSYKPITQQDSMFSVDGFYLLNKNEGRIFYTYYYRSQFVCLDTNMNYLYTGKTVDTNSVAKIKLATTHDGKLITHAKPPLYVNKMGYSFGKWLYIISDLASDEETKSQFKKHTVIDVYAIKNGSYYHSISVPNQGKSRISDFAITKGLLFAINNNYLTAYKIAN